jgi:DNA-binding transcriptional ArsR family regulator
MLETIFGSKLRARLIGWLFTHSDERYYVRQLTNLLDEDSTNVSRELARLAVSGILTMQIEGRQKYYQADPRSPVFDELRSMAVKTVGLGDLMRSALLPFRDRIRTAFIYGSFAKGRANAKSDIDIIIIGEISSAEAAPAISAAQQRLRREINSTIYPAKEFKSKLAGGSHFLNSLMQSEKILLFGDEHELARLVEKQLD